MLTSTAHGLPATPEAAYRDSQALASWSKRHQSWGESTVEKRIHPDINSLIDDGRTTLKRPWNIAYNNQKGNWSGIGTYMPFGTSAHSQVEASAIEGLHPRARPDVPREAHIRGDKGRTAPPDLIFGGVPNIKLVLQEEKEPHHPPALLPSIMRYESDTSIAGRSDGGGEPVAVVARSGTFGRRHQFSKKASSSSSKPNDTLSDFYSTSTPSASSHSISQSRKTSTHSLPRTPLFRHSPRSKPQYSGDLDHSFTVASPYTFGAPTPPRSDITVCPGRHDHNSYFGFREPPPPLPPLDHPALREALQFKAKRWSNGAVAIPNPTTSPRQGRTIQPSPSLPSLVNDGRKITAKLLGGRGRSNSASTGKISTREAFEQHIRPGRTKHARTQSKSSINSRRSSAEYSARQASSTHGSEHEDCWEVQVSRAMVKLALGEDGQPQETTTSRTNSSSLPTNKKQDAHANYGQARGKNVCSHAIVVCHTVFPDDCYLPFIFLFFSIL